jgi:glucose dehydrogenase
MKSSISLIRGKQTASRWTVGLMLATAPLWLMLAAANTSAQTPTAPSPADWTQFHRDNMQRWNPYETVLGVNNVGGLQVKWTYPTSFSNGIFDEALEQSSPAVVNGVVYVCGPLPPGTLKTPHPLWRTEWSMPAQQTTDCTR